MKLGSAIVVGVLTGGVSKKTTRKKKEVGEGEGESKRHKRIDEEKFSTAVGVGTLAYNMVDADTFVDRFWRYADSLAIQAAVIVSVEKYTFPLLSSLPSPLL